MLTHEIIAHAGWNRNLKIANGACELIVTLEVGPRLLHWAPIGGANVFHNDADQLGNSREALWQNRGGHRLWLAPESYPFSYYPDNGSVDHEIHPNGVVSLSTPPEPSGFGKQIEIALDAEKSQLRITHRIKNAGEKSREVAPWMLSVMAPGGVCILPQPSAKPHPGFGPGDFSPNRSLILWPFADLSDGRYFLGKRFFTLSQDANLGATKIGLNYDMKWVGYYNAGTLFVKKAPYDSQAIYPDRNCNFQTFTNEDMLEVETLGPLQNLAPDESLEQTENWELFSEIPDFDARDEASIAAALEKTGLV